MNWKCRYVSDNIKGRKVWKESNDDKLSFELESDTITIIHPHDENPLSEKKQATDVSIYAWWSTFIR